MGEGCSSRELARTRRRRAHHKVRMDLPHETETALDCARLAGGACVPCESKDPFVEVVPVHAVELHSRIGLPEGTDWWGGGERDREIDR